MIGFVGDKPMPRTEVTQDVAPQFVCVFDLHDFALRPMADPGTLFHLSLELAFGPPRVSEKSTDVKALSAITGGLSRGEVKDVMQLCIFLKPAECGEGESLRVDRPTDENRDIPQQNALLVAEVLRAHDLSNGVAERTVEHVPESSELRAVFGQKQHALIKSWLAQSGVGEYQASLQRIIDWRLL